MILVKLLGAAAIAKHGVANLDKASTSIPVRIVLLANKKNQLQQFIGSTKPTATSGQNSRDNSSNRLTACNRVANLRHSIIDKVVITNYCNARWAIFQVPFSISASH